jgi:hypothetical protein
VKVICSPVIRRWGLIVSNWSWLGLVSRVILLTITDFLYTRTLVRGSLLPFVSVNILQEFGASLIILTFTPALLKVTAVPLIGVVLQVRLEVVKEST